MKRNTRAHQLGAVLAGLLVLALALPAEAGGVNLGNLRALVLGILDDIGLVDSSGNNAAALGPSSSVDSYVSVFSGTSGKLLDDRPVTVASTGQVSWPTGLGAITHVEGPTDQALTFNGNATNGMLFRAGGSTRFAVGNGGLTAYASLSPATNGNRDLGTSSLRWNRIYASGGTVPSVLTKSVTSASTTAVTTEETLWSYSLPAGTLASDGQAVRIKAWGTTAANTNSKTVTIKFGSTSLRAASTTTSGVAWAVDAVVARTGASTQTASATSTFNVTGTALTAPAETLSGAVTIALTGTNGTANAGDIVFSGAIVEFLP